MIIQNNVGNKHSPTVIIASITSKTGVKAKLPTHYYIDAEDGLELPSIVLLEQLRTVDKRRLAIIVDTYGGYARHGGGAFSGKDCTKVDRSAAYAARYVAKNIVAAGLADKCEIQLSYAIGVAEPTSVMVDTFGTGKIADDKLVEIVRENFDLRPAGIIKMLDLRRPIYRGTAAYGHFGRTDLNLPWEATDKVDVLKKYL